jgi:hypothetical protein
MPSTRAVHHFRPALEQLETRAVPTTTVSCITNPAGTRVVITGDDGNNGVNIGDDGAGNLTIAVYENGVFQNQVSCASVGRVQADMGGGDDFFVYSFNADMTTRRSIDVTMGAGVDSFVMQEYGYGQHAPLDITVRTGNAGRGDSHPGVFDDVVMYFANVYADTTVNITGSVAPERINLNFQGQFGTPGADPIHVSVNYDGGAGDDGFNVLVGVGNPNCTMDFEVDAGTGDDSIQFRAFVFGTAQPGSITFNAQGGQGNDFFWIIRDDASGASVLSLDGGPGQDSALVFTFGSTPPDTISFQNIEDIVLI